MAIALVAHTSAGSSNGGVSVTTGAIDTTGASLLLAFVGDYNSVTASTVSDSKSNTWTALTTYSGGTNPRARIFYAKNPTVGTGHTFTATAPGAATFPGVAFYAFSGADTTAPFDSPQENGGGNTVSGTSFQPGSVAPSVDNELLFTGICLDGTFSAPTVDSSFTIGDSVAFSNGQTFGVFVAYQIQTTATTRNPTLSWTTAVTNKAGAIGTFKAATGGGVTYPQLERAIRGMNRGLAVGAR